MTEGYLELKEFKIFVDGKRVIGNCPHCYNTGRKVNINYWTDVFALHLTELKDLILKTKCPVCRGKGYLVEE